MRNLPLIPYDIFKKLTLENFTSKQIDLYLNLCKICNSNGKIDDKSKNSLINKIFTSIDNISTAFSGGIVSRSTAYRSIDKFIETGLLDVNEDGSLNIPMYRESFEEGSNGLVAIPMFCFTSKFKNLNKKIKQLALYFIGQIRDITKNSAPFPINVQNLAKKFNTYFSNVHNYLMQLKDFFVISLFHQDTVCMTSIRNQYLIDSSLLESMTKNFSENDEHNEKAIEIKSLLKSKEILQKLETRREQLASKKIEFEEDEVNTNKNIAVIVKKLKKYSYSDCSFILELLNSKLNQFSDPIHSLGAYITTLVKEHLKDKSLIKLSISDEFDITTITENIRNGVL